MLSSSFISIIILSFIAFINSDSEPVFDVSKLKISSKTDQIMLVIPKKYDSYPAELYYYIKSGNKWNEFLKTKAKIGRDGLGLQSEYDMKSPVGCFKFNKYFGIAKNPGTNMTYIQLNSSLYWVSDPKSSRYNQMVNIETFKDFNEQISEHLIEEAIAYQYVMSINYNEEAIPYKGSAIFLHCFKTNVTFTAGCVAVSKDDMINILKNVSEDAMIIIDVKDNIYNY